jgi:hypothetical protein
MLDKITKLFCETPVIDDNQLALSNKSKRMSGGETKEQQTQLRYNTCISDWDLIKTVKLNNGVRIEWFQDITLGQKRAFLLDSKNVIMGFLGCSSPELTDYPEFPRIQVVYVYDEHQGKGYGIAMYESTLDMFGGIVSDSTLSKASLGIWKKLSLKYPVYQYVFDYSHPGNSKRKMVPIKDLDKHLDSTNEPFVMSKKPLK